MNRSIKYGRSPLIKSVIRICFSDSIQRSLWKLKRRLPSWDKLPAAGRTVLRRLLLQSAADRRSFSLVRHPCLPPRIQSSLRSLRLRVRENAFKPGPLRPDLCSLANFDMSLFFVLFWCPRSESRRTAGLAYIRAYPVARAKF